MTDLLVPTELLTGVAEMDGQHDHLFNSMLQVKNALLSVSDVDEKGLTLLARLLDELLEHSPGSRKRRARTAFRSSIMPGSMRESRRSCAAKFPNCATAVAMCRR